GGGIGCVRGAGCEGLGGGRVIKKKILGSEEGGLGPVGVIAGLLIVAEPEGDVAGGGLAALDVDVPPAVGGPDQVAGVATGLGLLDDQGAEVGQALFEACALE